ncbi:DUF2252 domain-containing protein [Roseomonas nepalensis]|uniref:DUF2252 domain-containing protein n=1 Tax=Muricoccus nepalensis TaxID=1854500 RepID=A0A502G5C9_9PROT|nr:DUF2252 family protein [Roseomonas nepalensis]TPG57227.1 DUF2252 domain-containing protein [Roseomonas nepalensis]
MKHERIVGADPAGRSAALTARRNLKMAESAHAYVRGSTVRFYDWLEQAGRTSLPEGPGIWICGDCHVGNLGPIGGPDGALAVQIRDLDQTVIGNPAHDLLRLGLSLAMAARGSDLPGVTTARMLESMVAGYEVCFEPSDPDARDLVRPPDTVKRLLRDAARRSWKHLADERIEGVDPVIPLGRRFWPLRDEEREAMEDLVASEELRALVATLRSQDGDEAVALVDSAFWRKGCSSLGNLRFAVLVSVRSPGEKRLRYSLLDVKEAITAAAPRYADAAMPRDNAVRVVEGACHLSPNLGQRMLATRLLGKGVFVRELLPQDLKLEVERLDQEEASEMASYLAMVVGRAHSRQMSATERKAWLSELQRNRSRSLDAPSWLWRAVVDLVASHEAAYLEHCRRYALQPTLA